MATKDCESPGEPAIRELVREKSVTMEYFLESSHLDAATADMLRKYDRDGNGSFSKEEVVAIILDLREAMESNEMLGASNKLFKRMLIGVTAFALLLLTSMFGLSYAVAALTAKLDVSSDGTMTTTDGKTKVSTDASSYKIVPVKNEESGAFCISYADSETLLQQAMSGKTNVLIEFDGAGLNGTQTLLQQVSGGSVDTDGIKTCFTNAQGKEVCIEPSDDCTVGRRSLQETTCFSSFQSSSATFTATMRALQSECITTCFSTSGNTRGFGTAKVFTEAGAICVCGGCIGENIKVSP